METLKAILSHPFFWGLCLGLLFFFFSFTGHWKTRRELRRFQKHLSDKLELEAKQYEMVRREKEVLAKENENLRLKVGHLTERPESKLGREMEVMARAEKRMMINAPGFAAAWETAKADAVREIEAEDRGESMPRRLFTRLFGTGGHNGEEQALLEAGSGRSGGEAEPAAKVTGDGAKGDATGAGAPAEKAKKESVAS